MLMVPLDLISSSVRKVPLLADASAGSVVFAPQPASREAATVRLRKTAPIFLIKFFMEIPLFLIKFRESKHKKCRGFNQLPGKWRYDIPSEKSRFRCSKMYTNAPRHTDMPGRYAFDNKTVLHKN